MHQLNPDKTNSIQIELCPDFADAPCIFNICYVAAILYNVIIIIIQYYNIINYSFTGYNETNMGMGSRPRVVDEYPEVGYITPDNKSVSNFNLCKINFLESVGFPGLIQISGFQSDNIFHSCNIF